MHGECMLVAVFKKQGTLAAADGVAHIAFFMVFACARDHRKTAFGVVQGLLALRPWSHRERTSAGR